MDLTPNYILPIDAGMLCGGTHVLNGAGRDHGSSGKVVNQLDVEIGRDDVLGLMKGESVIMIETMRIFLNNFKSNMQIYN